MKKLVSLSFLLLVGCMVGPDYHEPPLAIPQKWENALKSAEAKSPIWQEVYWWKNYKDPLLSYLIQETLKSNYDLKTAFSKICEARALLLGADATLTPQINGVGSFSRNENSLTTREFSNDPSAGDSIITSPRSIRDFDLYMVGLSTTWEVDLFGRLRRGVESAEATLEAQVEDTHNTLLSLIGDVALHYINLRGYQQQIDITQKSLKAWESIYKLTQDLFRAGLVTVIDVENAKTSLDQTKAKISPLKANIKTTIHQLSVLVGKSPTHLYTFLLKDKPIPFIPMEIFAGLPSDLLKQRPDIRRAERKLAASTADIGVAEGRLFPVFSLTGSVGYQSNNASNLFSPLSGFYSLGPSFSWPLADFGRIRAKIYASMAVRDQNLYQYQNTVLKALADVESALVNYAAEGKKYYDLQSSYEASKIAAEASLLRYEAGRITFINVLQAELTYQANALALAQSQTTLALNSVTLYKALGGGWQVDKTEWGLNPH